MCVSDSLKMRASKGGGEMLRHPCLHEKLNDALDSASEYSSLYIGGDCNHGGGWPFVFVHNCLLGRLANLLCNACSGSSVFAQQRETTCGLDCNSRWYSG